MEAWMKTADLSAEETAKKLYEKALDEDVLHVYTVSGRIYDVAESFQKELESMFKPMFAIEKRWM